MSMDNIKTMRLDKLYRLVIMIERLQVSRPGHTSINERLREKRDEFRRRLSIAGGKESNIVAQGHLLLHKMVNNDLGPPIIFRWNSNPRWRNVRNLHKSLHRYMSADD